MNTATQVFDYLIDSLEINKINFKRIMDYITIYDNYEGYDYVINNYQDFLTIEERKRLINKGKKLFDNELMEDWE